MKKLYFFLLGIIVLSFYLSASAQNPVLNRTVTFVNQCPFPVWFGAVVGGAPNKTNQGGQCASNADCVQGAYCDTNKNQCFWNMPLSTNNNYQLVPNGGTDTIQIPSYANGINPIWSGVFAGSTGCVGSQCQTGDCERGNNPNAPCGAGKGFMPPTTQAEFTFNSQSGDVYDVEINNGVNIPVEITPNLSNSGQLKTNPNNPYWCGNPGAVNPLNQGLGQCSWQFTPPNPQWAYTWVTPGGTLCVNNACPTGQVCGLSVSPQNPRMQQTCGQQLGWWTAMQVCGNDPTFGAPFNCSQSYAPIAGTTLANLYQCNQSLGNSCYSKGANGTNCCGCANWNLVTWNGQTIVVPPGPATTQCVAQNPTWLNLNLPTQGNPNNGSLAWLKQACPTVYTYPYDDPSSTFTCSNQVNSGQTNSVNYNVVFCPGGKTGIPTNRVTKGAAK